MTRVRPDRPAPADDPTGGSSVAEDLVLLAVDPARRRLHAPSLDYLLAAADIADELLTGTPLPADTYRSIRERGGPTRGARSDRTLAALHERQILRLGQARRLGIVPVDEVELLDVRRRTELVATLTSGLRHASTLPLRLGLVAALAATGGVARDALERAASDSADDLAAGVVELVADPSGHVATLADGLRAALDSLG